MTPEQARQYLAAAGGDFDQPVGVQPFGMGTTISPQFWTPSAGDVLVFQTRGGKATLRVTGDGNYAVVDPANPVLATGEERVEERAATRKRSSLATAAKANPYVAMAIEAAANHGVPPDIFVAQIRQESGFNPNARGAAGETGIAQFMPGSVPVGVDPLDPAQALDAAAARMAAAQAKYGSWEKALQQYNGGDGGVGIPAAIRYSTKILADAEAIGTEQDPLLGVRAVRASDTETPAEAAERAARTANYLSQITDRELSRPSEIGLRQAQTESQLAQAARTRQQLIGKQQLLLDQAEQTITSIQNQLRAGTIGLAEATKYSQSVWDFVDAGLRGTTPAEEAAAQARETRERADIGRSLLNQQVASGASLANSLLSAYTTQTKGLLEPLTEPFAPMAEAEEFVGRVGGGPEVSDVARSLVLALRAPGPGPGVREPEGLGLAGLPPGAVDFIKSFNKQGG